MGAGGWGGKVMVTAATLLGDCKHVYNEAIIKLLMLTSHAQWDSLPSGATAGKHNYSTKTGPGRCIHGWLPHLFTACWPIKTGISCWKLILWQLYFGRKKNKHSFLLFHSLDGNNTKLDFPVCLAVFKPTIAYTGKWGATHLRQHFCIR